tara:strand:- start:29 stop:277 length:249 start_codon:yes stop_codon:yes gene_type:complete
MRKSLIFLVLIVGVLFLAGCTEVTEESPSLARQISDDDPEEVFNVGDLVCVNVDCGKNLSGHCDSNCECTGDGKCSSGTIVK